VEYVAFTLMAGLALGGLVVLGRRLRDYRCPDENFQAGGWGGTSGAVGW